MAFNITFNYFAFNASTAVDIPFNIIAASNIITTVYSTIYFARTGNVVSAINSAADRTAARNIGSCVYVTVYITLTVYILATFFNITIDFVAFDFAVAYNITIDTCITRYITKDFNFKILPCGFITIMRKPDANAFVNIVGFI